MQEPGDLLQHNWERARRKHGEMKDENYRRRSCSAQGFRNEWIRTVFSGFVPPRSRGVKRRWGPPVHKKDSDPHSEAAALPLG